MSAHADPLSEYLTYLADVRTGGVGDMGFTFGGFQALPCFSMNSSAKNSAKGVGEAAR
jgi:hypothetical protein